VLLGLNVIWKIQEYEHNVINLWTKSETLQFAIFHAPTYHFRTINETDTDMAQFAQYFLLFQLSFGWMIGKTVEYEFLKLAYCVGFNRLIWDKGTLLAVLFPSWDSSIVGGRNVTEYFTGGTASNLQTLQPHRANHHVVYQGQIHGGPIGAISSLKPTKVTFFTMILYNSKNSFRDIIHIAVHCLSQQYCEVYFIPLRVVNP